MSRTSLAARQGNDRPCANEGPFTPEGKTLTEGTGSPDEKGSAQQSRDSSSGESPALPRQAMGSVQSWDWRTSSCKASPAPTHAGASAGTDVFPVVLGAAPGKHARTPQAHASAPE